METVFEDVSEIEESLKKAAPAILYKYRDWMCDFHKDILLKNEIWLSHPKSLNDDMDVRVPLRFNYEEIDNPLFFDKLKSYAAIHNWFPNTGANSNDFLLACKNKHDEIKQNPTQYFERSYEGVYNGDDYDSIGILSLTTNPLSRTMWAHYGNNSKGFCVGFQTSDLFKDIMPISFGRVDYLNEPMKWSFIRAEEEKLSDWFYLKHSDWSYEAEYRFITPDINDNTRSRVFNKSTVKELVVGANISEIDLGAIVDVLKKSYSSEVLLYKVKRSFSSYAIGRERVAY